MATPEERLLRLLRRRLVRLRKMELRIRRLKPLPVTFLTKCDLASMSCLSLLDYVNHPNVSSVRGLKGPLTRGLWDTPMPPLRSYTM